MLKVTDYHLLVLRGFDALKREIQEAEQYTVSQYNAAVQQQNAVEAQQNQQTAPAQPKTTTTTTKKKEN